MKSKKMLPRDGRRNNAIRRNEMNVYLLHVFMFASIRYKRLFICIISNIFTNRKNFLCLSTPARVEINFLLSFFL